MFGELLQIQKPTAATLAITAGIITSGLIWGIGEAILVQRPDLTFAKSVFRVLVVVSALFYIFILERAGMNILAISFIWDTAAMGGWFLVGLYTGTTALQSAQNLRISGMLDIILGLALFAIASWRWSLGWEKLLP